MISADFVEKALVGALMNHPERKADVPWLHVEDFTHPLCRALWAHLESGDRPAITPLEDLPAVTELLRRADGLHPQHCGPAQVAELQINAPEPAAVAEYGRILVEVAIRRELTAMGLRLEPEQAGQPGTVIQAAGAATLRIHELRRRWHAARAAASPRSRVDDSWGLAPPLDVGGQSVADIDLDPRTAELAVIGAAVHDWPPGARQHLLARVRTGDFDDPGPAATWDAIQRLVARGGAVDQVTVAWEGARTKAGRPRGMGSRELADSRALAALFDDGAAVLARRAVAKTLAKTRLALRQNPENLSINPDDLLVMADHQHRNLANEASRSTRRAYGIQA